jgi:hypothetical protein
VAQATIPIQVPSDLDITHWVLQRTNQLAPWPFAYLRYYCFPPAIDLANPDVIRLNGFAILVNVCRCKCAITVAFTFVIIPANCFGLTS